jgi:hypothetical protein
MAKCDVCGNDYDKAFQVVRSRVESLFPFSMDFTATHHFE